MQIVLFHGRVCDFLKSFFHYAIHVFFHCWAGSHSKTWMGIMMLNCSSVSLNMQEEECRGRDEVGDCVRRRLVDSAAP